LIVKKPKVFMVNMGRFQKDKHFRWRKTDDQPYAPFELDMGVYLHRNCDPNSYDDFKFNRYTYEPLSDIRIGDLLGM
jgi:hypothetical protein